MEKSHSFKNALKKSVFRVPSRLFAPVCSKSAPVFTRLFELSLKVGAILIVIIFSAQQSGSVPESVRRPEQLSEPSYPSDLSIGELGVGDAVPEAYVFARRVLNDAQQNKSDSALLSPVPAETRKEFLANISSITPRKLRIGGGQLEADGHTSFLFRYIGREKELAGEIYMSVSEEGAWKLEQIISENTRNLSEARESDHPYSYTPYDRFW